MKMSNKNNYKIMSNSWRNTIIYNKIKILKIYKNYLNLYQDKLNKVKKQINY